MTTTFDQHYDSLFLSEINMEYARTGPQLRDVVQVRNTQGNNTVYFKKMGSGVATTKARGAQATYMNLNRSRVSATPTDLYAVELIAEPDEIRTGSSERPAVQQRCVEALGRAWDDDLITTLATSTNTAPTTSGGLTLAKILEGQTYMLDNNVPLNRLTWLIGPEQLADMETSIDEFKSIDYASRKAFERPDVTSFVFKNMNFMVFNALPISGSNRTCFLVDKGAVGAILPKDINVSIDRRVDLVNEWQVAAWMSHGSVLIQPTGVLEITCAE